MKTANYSREERISQPEEEEPELEKVERGALSGFEVKDSSRLKKVETKLKIYEDNQKHTSTLGILSLY